ncbi:RNA-dependent RNA polymerase [Erysiphe necator associated narnavirus 30]|nr:RNA-dependent RNA polymerase [Erysiphe necator associated narnavirus 30]
MSSVKNDVDANDDTASTSKGGIPFALPTDLPWDYERHVLSTGSFVGCCILRSRGRNRNGHGTCSCKGEETHRDLFGFNRTVVSRSLHGVCDIGPVKVCWNAENLFECKLNKDLSGRKDRVLFKDLKTVSEAYSVLWKGTHWFPRLLGKQKTGATGRNGVAVMRLLANLPSYAGKETVSEILKMKLNAGSVNKLRSILATVDGLLMQLIISFPDRKEYNSWERVDQIQSCMIGQLLPDYFRDKDRDLSRSSTFEKVKKLRKQFKEQAFNPVGSLENIDIPREMSFFKAAMAFISDRKSPMDIWRASLLCQTRASGVPPRSVYFKTLLKIKDLLQEEADPEVYASVAGFIQPSVYSIHAKILEKLGSESKTEMFWKRCLDKAKISLSDSGEFFTNAESGGKLEAARKVLASNVPIPKVDLFTGSLGPPLNREDTPVGELLFNWACHMFHDRETCYERNLMSVRISLVAELGKYRAITVSHLAHAMLLHVLSHVLLEYLTMIPSSESGVKAGNHAWNFFKRLSHKNPRANFIFGDKDVYLFSTDWETATDYCNQTVAQVILNHLCTALGIPRWYRETCVFALCAPRQVEFIDEKSKLLEVFYTERGELMGDPVTKVILHYYHLVARESALMQIVNVRNTRHKWA